LSDVVDVKLTLCVISVVSEFVSTGLVPLKVVMTTLSVVSTSAVVSTVLVGENRVMATLSVVAYKSVVGFIVAVSDSVDMSFPTNAGSPKSTRILDHFFRCSSGHIFEIHVAESLTFRHMYLGELMPF
jgi:hypothetical protein